MDSTSEQYETHFDKLLDQHMSAPTTVSRDGRLKALARSGSTTLKLARWQEGSHTARHCIVSTTAGKLSIHNSHPEDFSGKSGKYVQPPTNDVVRLLKKAVPLPVDHVWGVMQGGKVVELLYFEGSIVFRGVPEDTQLCGVVVKEQTAKNLGMTLRSDALDDVFWKYVSQGKLTSLHRHLRKIREFQTGRTPDGEAVAFVIDNVLLMHPDSWKKYRTLTPADLKSVKDAHSVVEVPRD